MLLTQSDADLGLRIGGFTPLTSIDYPGQLSAVVFCQGCPWRCGYCQNEHLISAKPQNHFHWPAIDAFLQTRQGLLDAVVFSGGEPLAQSALHSAMARVKALGFLVGLHTGGAYPDRLSEVIHLVDWVGLDIKTLPALYHSLTGVAKSAEKAFECLSIIQNAKVALEVRTTVHSHLLNTQQLSQLASLLAQKNVEHWVVQPCLTRAGLAAALPASEWDERQVAFVCAELKPLFKSLSIR